MWFTTLPPNSILNQDRLEITFHKQFFKDETHANLIDLFNIQRFPTELIDDYLNQFRQMKARCYTQIPEHELFKMATSSLDFFIHKKLVNE